MVGQEGGAIGVDPAAQYNVQTLLVGENSAAIHEGVELNLKGRSTSVSQGSRELYYDQIASVSYDGDALSIQTSDGENLSYPSTRKPTGALEDLQNKVRAYKTE